MSNFVELNIVTFEGAISQFFVAMNAFILKRVQLQVGKSSPSFYQVSTIVFNMIYKLKDLFNFTFFIRSDIHLISDEASVLR